MAKNFLNDIRPMGGDERQHHSIDAKSLPESDRPINLPPKFVDRNFDGDTPRRSNKMIWLVLLLVIVGAAIAVSSLFAKAVVTLTPKSSPVTLENSVFSAVLIGTDKALSFKIVKATGSATKTATATTTSTADTKAKGTVILYNTYSTAPQKLTIETRLSTTDGKIYKTDVATVIPGTKTVGGKTVAGSIEVGIHADLAGPTYNIGLSDFSIVGFKGTPKYQKFYARGKTPISGGATGKQYVLSEAEARVAHEAALAALSDKLRSDVRATLPPDSLFLPGAAIVKETPGPTTYSGDTEKVSVEVKGTLIGVLFDKEEFVNKIAEANIHDFDHLPVSIPELDQFVVDLKNKDTLSETTAAISFGLSGKGTVVWNIDQAKVLEALLGIKKKDTTMKLATFPSILKAKVTITPFWKFSVPENKDKVKVIIESPVAAATE